MTKISQYSTDVNITGNDKWIGSDAQNYLITKNFTPNNLANYFNGNNVIDIGTSIRYKYQTLDPGEAREQGTISFETEIGPQVNFSAITTFLIAKNSLKQNDVSQYLDFLVDGKVLLSKASNINVFGYYKITSLQPWIPNTNFFVVTVDFLDGNGFIYEDLDYLVSLVDKAQDVITPTLQSVVNAGNGISNFGGIGVASIQSTNFINNRTLYLNDNSYPTIRLVDNGNSSHNLTIDLDTISLNGTSYNWSSIVSGVPQDLQQVTDIGNTTTNDIQFINSAEAIFGANGGILLDNGSRLREGTIDAGLGGSKGIAQICAVGYELKWEAGRLYVMDGNGAYIRWSLYNFNITPTINDDVTKGYLNGSRWTLDNGDVYECTDDTTGAAVWELVNTGTTPTLQQVTDVGNTVTSISGTTELNAGYIYLNNPTNTEITNIAANGIQLQNLDNDGFALFYSDGLSIGSSGYGTVLFPGGISFTDASFGVTSIYTNGTKDPLIEAAITLPSHSGTLALTSDIPPVITPTLQIVTDNGNVTTNIIKVKDASNNAIYSLIDKDGVFCRQNNGWFAGITVNFLGNNKRGFYIVNPNGGTTFIKMSSAIGFNNPDFILPNKSTGDHTFAMLDDIPTVGTWGALNYPTWTTGTPFVKMTAAGTFALDTNTYLTSAVTSVTASGPLTSSGGNTPVISTSVNTNSLIGRYSSGTGRMEEIRIGDGLTLSGDTLTSTTASPLTTKGDLYTFSTTNTRLPIGTNGQVLTVKDGSGPTNLVWANLPTKVSEVTAVSPITSTEGIDPVISTSMSTNKLIGRYSAGTGVMQEVTIGSGLTLTGAGVLNNTATPTPTGYYAQYQDVITQTVAVINTGYPIKFRTLDISNGVSVVSDSRITFANTGIYNLQFSVQLENSDTQEHDVTIWLRKNGVDVAGSSGFVAVVSKHGGVNGHVLPSWNYLLDVVAGEYYELVWSATSTQVTMPFIAAGSPPPSTASALFTVTQQAGIMAGTGMTSLTTTGSSGAATYNSGTGALNIPQYMSASTRRNANNSSNNNINYCGVALGTGVSESSAVWTIKRLTIAESGSITTATATNVAWTNRESATYI